MTSVFQGVSIGHGPDVRFLEDMTEVRYEDDKGRSVSIEEKKGIFKRKKIEITDYSAGSVENVKLTRQEKSDIKEKYRGILADAEEIIWDVTVQLAPVTPAPSLPSLSQSVDFDPDFPDWAIQHLVVTGGTYHSRPRQIVAECSLDDAHEKCLSFGIRVFSDGSSIDAQRPHFDANYFIRGGKRAGFPKLYKAAETYISDAKAESTGDQPPKVDI